MEIKQDVPMDKIKKVSNVRNENVDIEDLKASIEQHGLLQPIVVSEKSGRYRIIAGHRRHLACQALGYETIPAVVKTFKHPMAVQITENVQRTDMSKQEESKAVWDLKRRMDCNKADLMRMLGKPHNWVSKRLAFHEVRTYLLNEEFPSKSVSALTYDIAVRMAKYGRSHWRKMAAASLGKTWYPKQLDTLFRDIVHPEVRKESKTAGNIVRKGITEALDKEESLEFSIDADDGKCIMKLLFVNKHHYQKVRDTLVSVGGEII